jgi:hypothetical protein
MADEAGVRCGGCWFCNRAWDEWLCVEPVITEPAGASEVAAQAIHPAG